MRGARSVRVCLWPGIRPKCACVAHIAGLARARDWNLAACWLRPCASGFDCVLTEFGGARVCARVCVNGGQQEIDVEAGVLVLTDDNFQTALDLYGPLLVEFYAPVR